MRKIPQQVAKLLLHHTPAYTRPTVETNIKLTKLESIEDKNLQPIIHYLDALQKHKEYLDFFQIGIFRDQKKKIENVAKYVGLAIRDYSQAHQAHQTNLRQKLNQKNKVEDLSTHSQIIQNWVNHQTTKQKEVAEAKSGDKK